MTRTVRIALYCLGGYLVLLLLLLGYRFVQLVR
jgi:hypothetical protein